MRHTACEAIAFPHQDATELPVPCRVQQHLGPQATDRAPGGAEVDVRGQNLQPGAGGKGMQASSQHGVSRPVASQRINTAKLR